MGRLGDVSRAARGVARDHRGLLILLAVAAVLRLAFWVAYRPALFFSDSWTYLSLAWDSTIVGFSPDRPSGYSLLVKGATGPWHSVGALTLVQHAFGLATGAVVYALARRLDAARWIALVAAGIVLLDGYAITLEQTVLPEAAVTLLIAAGALLAIEAARAPDRATRYLVAGGVLLAVAISMRSAILFLVPAWLAYVLVARLGPRRLAVAVVAVALPLLAYSAVHKASEGTFGMTDAGGWFLYGRVGEIADCRGLDVADEARPLCNRTAADEDGGAAFHIWNPGSAANRSFDGILSGNRQQNDFLREFAGEVIRERPGEYARIVIADFGRFFVPGEMSRGYSDAAIVPPEEPRTAPPFMNTTLRDRHLSGFEPAVHSPAGAVRAYVDWVHTPRWAMGAAMLLMLTVLVLALFGRFRAGLSHAKESLLLGGGALCVLLGSVAASEFIVRYMLPVVPLIVVGGAVAASDLTRAIIDMRSRKSGATIRSATPAA